MGKRGNGFELKERRFGLNPRKEIPDCEGGESLERVDQINCGCPIPGDIPGQVVWSFGQPGLVEVFFPMAERSELDL